MSNNYISSVVIDDFKCYQQLEVDDFKRVNLIGGKNNIGKTTLIEALYISKSSTPFQLYEKLLEIETHRNLTNNLLSNTTRQEDFRNLIKSNLDINIITNNNSNQRLLKVYQDGSDIVVFTDEQKRFKISEMIDIFDIDFKSSKQLFSLNFITPYSNSDTELNNIISQSKFDGKYEILNQYLLDIFNVTIDVLKNKPMLKIKDKYIKLSQFGQGIKTFINIIASMSLLENDIIFIDEVENGIHYTNFDKIWEIIFDISKKQNIQVFITTHSKECIESYYKISNELEEDDLTFINLSNNNDKSIAITLDSEMFKSEIEQNHEVRAW